MGDTRRATFAERMAMRRELVLSVIRRRPGLTIREIGEEIGDLGGRYLLSGVEYDVRLLRKRGLVDAVKINARTVLWVPSVQPAMPLLWEGDDA